MITSVDELMRAYHIGCGGISVWCSTVSPLVGYDLEILECSVLWRDNISTVEGDY